MSGIHAQAFDTVFAGGGVDQTITGAKTFNSLLTAAAGLTVSAGALTVTGTGPHVIGGAADATTQLLLTGTFTPTGTGRALSVASTINAGVGQEAYGLHVAPTLVEAGSGTHALLAGAYFAAPTITGGAATVTNAATLYIAGAPSGTVSGANYTVWAAGSGISRFDGEVAFNTGALLGTQVVIGGAFSPTVPGPDYSVLRTNATLNAASAGDVYYYAIAPVITTPDGAATGQVNGLRVDAPTIALGAGATLSGGTTVYIQGAPSVGTSKAALYVDTLNGGMVLIKGSGPHEIAGSLTLSGTSLGFYNTAPQTKQTVTGSRGGNAALASLLTALATIGLMTDSSS